MPRLSPFPKNNTSHMKKIEAIIRKTKFDEVKDALLEADFEWFSYYDIRGVGKALDIYEHGESAYN